jgi:hypothetical protein
MDLNQRITISDEVLSTGVDDEMVLLDMKSEKYFGFDEVGAAIWQAMKKKDSLTEVYEVLLAEYRVKPEILKRDLLDFVKELEERGVISLKPVS